ncbi:MAG: hypothetical protein J2P30_11995 [Actinobacteria bacterium]|nr:hypothetical protein [Actinomycetota bacterium]
MYHNDACGGGHGGRRRARLRRPGLLAAALACLAVTAAACSSSPGTAGGSAKNSELAFSRCMRAHGITAFPDPNAQGGTTLNAGPGTGINPNSPQFQAANSACKSLLPAGAAVSPAQRAQMLRYAQCMRAHGISDFPDPDNQGHLAIKSQPGDDLDPHNPRYQAADKACRHYQPGRGGLIGSGS